MSASQATHVHNPLEIDWLLSIDLSIATLLLLTVITIVVVVTNDSRRSFNKLTMLPYYFMISFCLLTMTEFACLNVMHRSPEWMAFINLNKGNALFISIAIQNYEWLNALGMIHVQKQLDVTTVPTERWRFRPAETWVFRSVIAFLALYLLSTNALLARAYLTSANSDTNPCQSWADRDQIAFVISCFSTVIFVFTMVLFPRSVWKHFRAAWIDYRTKFLIQATGAGLLQASILGLSISRLLFSTNQQSCEGLLGEIYLKLNFCELIGCFLMMCFKSPQDIFKLFNKRPDVQFSIFQYPNQLYAEQKIAMAKNEQIIK